MILDEVIERYKRNAEYERTHGNLQGCLEFRQLVKWLEDYKRLKEQEPSGDLISRQAAIDVIEKWLECSDYNEAERHIMRATESILYDLPSVNQQEPCEDAISRQALLDDLGMTEKTRKYGGDHSGYNTMMLYEIQDIIESQPPV